MATNVAVEKNLNENNTSLMRRFTRRVQESGIVKRVRGIRYSERNRSAYVKKQKALESMARRENRERLSKLGKLDLLAKKKRK